MVEHPERPVSVFHLLGSIRNHKFLAVITFLFVFALAVAAWLWLPKQYGSEGRLYVQLGRGNVGLDPLPEDSNRVSIQDTRETEIRSVVELLKSRGLTERVVDQIGAERILENELRLPFDIEAFAASLSPNPAASDMDQTEYRRLMTREKAVKKLQTDMSAYSEKKTSVIAVHSYAASPELAREIVNALMNGVKELHVAVHAAGQSKDFFDREFESQKQRLQQSEIALREFRDLHGFLSVDEARTTLNGVIDKLENQLVDVGIDLQQSRQTVDALQRQMASISTQIETPTMGLERASTESAQGQLYARRAEKARLVAKYNENHPRVDEINKEIEKLQAEIDALPEERTQKVLISNPVHNELQVALITELARAESLAARRDRIQNEVQTASSKLKQLNQLKVTGDALQRDIDVAQQYLDTYVKKRGEAMVVDQLDKQRISDVIVAQDATLILKKQSPKGSVVLPLGALFAGVASLCICLVADRKKLTRPTTSHEIEQSLDLPVLATIPKVHSSRVAVN